MLTYHSGYLDRMKHHLVGSVKYTSYISAPSRQLRPYEVFRGRYIMQDLGRLLSGPNLGPCVSFCLFRGPHKPSALSQSSLSSTPVTTGAAADVLTVQPQYQ